jgi:serine/threonine protein phosphatase PrpC
MNLNFFKYSDRGPREENQDALDTVRLRNFSIACIADGVGGGNCGSLASNESIKFFLGSIESCNFHLQKCIDETHAHIKYLQAQDPRCQGMATTFTTALISEKSLRGIHVGDSKLCVLRGNGVKQLTTPHTEVERLINAGKIPRSRMASYPRKNILESALGIKGNLITQEFEFNLRNGDRILLTTDGVHDVISKAEFRDMSINTKELNDFGNIIIQKLNSLKLTDNVSFMIIECI